MKKTILLILFAVLMAAQGKAWIAYNDYALSLQIVYNLGNPNASVVIIKGNNTKTEVTIPETYTINGNTYNITEITNDDGEPAAEKVKTLIIPASVKKVGVVSYDCPNLENVIILGDELDITKYAFDGCKNLKYNVYDNGFYIGDNSNPYKCLIKSKDNGIIKVKKVIEGQELEVEVNNIQDIEIHKDCKIIAGFAIASDNIQTLILPQSVACLGKYALPTWCDTLIVERYGNKPDLTDVGSPIAKIIKRGEDFQHVISYHTFKDSKVFNYIPPKNFITGTNIVFTTKNKTYVNKGATITTPKGYDFVSLNTSLSNIESDDNIVVSKLLSHSDISISLAQKTYSYTGDFIEPEVIIKDKGKVLRYDKDYVIIQYSHNRIVTTDARILIRGNVGYGYTGDTTITFTINKATPTIQPPIPIEGLVYNGYNQDLFTYGSTNIGSLKYSLDGENWNSTIQPKLLSGEYTVYYTLSNDPNINIPEVQSIKCTIAKATPKITPPTPIEGLVYNGDNQKLFTKGSTDIGTMVYSFSLDSEIWVTEYLASIEACEYIIYYKLKNDPNINIPEVQSIKCTIATANGNNNNNGNPSTPVSEISSNNGSAKVWSYNHTLYIESAADTKYKILDLNGRTIATSTTKSTKEEIQLNHNGIVIVLIDGKAFKVSVN